MSSSIFSAKGRSYTVNHILQAADFRGELRPLRLVWQRRWAAICNAQAAEVEVNEAVLDKLAADFRYAHNLVTAEETEKWLEALGLSADAFGDYIVRCALAGVPDLFAEEEGKKSPEEKPPRMDEQQARCFHLDFIFSTSFQQMARALSWRVALNCEEPNPDNTFDSSIATRETTFLPGRRETGAQAEDWLTDGEETSGWAAELPGLEARFQAESASLLTDANRRRALVALRLPLMHLSLEMLEVDSEAAAREAYLCATEDNIALETLAEENRHAFRQITDFLETLPKNLQQVLISASPGSVLRPLPVGEEFQLCRLVSKREPTLDDPAVAARVDASILSAHFRELESRHVRWQVNLELEEA